MAPAPVNHPNARKTAANRGKDEFVERESRLLLIHPVQVHPRLNGKTSRAEVVQIEPATRLYCGLNIFGSLFDPDIAVPDERFQRAQRFGLIVLRQYLHRRTMVERDGAPAESLYILHRMLEQFIVSQAGRKPRNRKVPLFAIRCAGRCAGRESNPAIPYKCFKDCKRFVHTAPGTVYPSLVYNAAS